LIAQRDRETLDMTNIKQQFAANSVWVVLGRGSTNFAGFVIFVLLARFLGPADFGLVTFAALFIELTRPLAQAGFPQALIQRPTWDNDVASNAFWVTVILAIIVALLLWGALTPFMTANYDPKLEWVLPSLALTLVIDAMRATHEAKLQREFSYKLLAKRSVFATIIGGIIGVVLAYFGFGVWALVINRLVTSLLLTLILWNTVRWAPKFTLSVGTLKPLFAFGIHLSGAGLIGQVNRRVADILIGAFLGPASVGFFRAGTRAVNMLNDAVIQPMNQTALSALSRVNEAGSVAKAYLRITKACGLISFPIYYGTAVTAHDFVLVFFGTRWEASGDVMSMFALFGGAGTLNYFSGAALSAVGRTRLVLCTNLFSLISSIILTVVLVKYGIWAVALGFAVRAHLVVPFVLMMLKRGLHLRPIAAIRGILPPFLAASVMALLLVLLKLEVLGDLSPLVRLAILVPVGAALYVGGLFLFGRKYVKEMQTELAPIVNRFLRRFRK
jgi:O-antigen/teichoic acid export membrane protein